MATTKTFLRSWHGGEISPDMLGRIDSVQFQAGAARLRNFILRPQGVLVSRPGFSYVARTKSDAAARIVTFDSGPDDSLIVMIGAGWTRFFRDGAAITITGVRAFQGAVNCTFAAAGVTVTQANHTHVEGDPVRFTTTGTLPAQLVVGTTYYVRNVVALTSYELSATPTGAIITFATAGVGTHTARRVYLLADVVRSGGIDYYCTLSNDSVAPPNTQWHALTSLGGGVSVYEIPNPYLVGELFELNFDQVNDVMTLAHRSQYPRELRRYSDTNWTLVGVSAEATVLAPTGLEAVAISQGKLLISAITAANPGVFSFTTTAAHHNLLVGDGVYLRGVLGTMSTVAPDGFYVVHGIPGGPGASVTCSLKRYDGTVVDTSALAHTANTGTLEPWPRTADATNRYKITSQSVLGDESQASTDVSCFNNVYAPGASNLLMWESATGAARYKLYKHESGIFRYMGEVDATIARRASTVTFTFAAPMVVTWNAHGLAEGTPFRLSVAQGGSFPAGMAGGAFSATTTYYVRNPQTNSFNFSTEPNGQLFSGAGGAGGTTVTATERWHFYDENIGELGDPEPSRNADDLVTAGNFPSAVGHHQQRRFFGGSTNDPQTFFASRSGTESDFAFHLPALPTDRLKWEIAVRRFADIRHIVPLGDLLMLTGSSEVRAFPVDGQVLSPDTIATIAQSHVGSSRVRPQLVHHSMVFAGARGGHVYEIGYNQDRGGYQPADLSLRASHLFDGLDLVDSAQSKSPFPILWFTNTEGQLLGLTYVPEEGIAGWHVHETQGDFESVAVAQEGDEDRVYAVIKRTIDGSTVRTLERMGTIAFDELEDWCALDGAVTKTSGLPSTTVTGLGHLEGEVVAVFRDGNLHPNRTVDTGSITLAASATSKVHVGLAFTAELETLPLALQIEAFAQGRNMNVKKAILRMVRTANVQVGPDDTKLTNVWPLTSTQELHDTLEDVTQRGQWALGGPILVRQPYPLPVTLVSMTLDLAIGD